MRKSSGFESRSSIRKFFPARSFFALVQGKNRTIFGQPGLYMYIGLYRRVKKGFLCFILVLIEKCKKLRMLHIYLFDSSNNRGDGYLFSLS
jgi:hypothetical protein